MEIFCGKCNNNIGLQTNEEYSSMFLECERLKKENAELKTIIEKQSRFVDLRQKIFMAQCSSKELKEEQEIRCYLMEKGVW